MRSLPTHLTRTGGHAQPSPDRGSRRRGSVLLLVVASIAMLAFLGGLFLVTTHTQRFVAPDVGSDRSSTRQSDANLVLESVNAEIARQIKADVFNPVGTPNEGAAFDIGRGVEITDRAWLNPTATGVRQPVGLDGSAAPVTLIGGEQDDAWLASTFPHQVNGVAGSPWVWERITSLTGGSFHVVDFSAQLNAPFTSVTDTGDDRTVRPEASGERYADFYETALTAGQTFNIDAYGTATEQRADPSSSPPAAPLLVDADGDGVPDARFERAPVATAEGLEDFMAVRIVDLASLLNVNTATTAVEASNPPYDTNEPPRARHPGDLDAGQFFGINLHADPNALTAFTDPASPTRPYDPTDSPFLDDFLGEPGRPGLLGLRVPSSEPPGARPTEGRRTAYYDAADPYAGPPAGYQLLPGSLEADLRQRMGVFDDPDNGDLRTLATRIAVEPRTQHNRDGALVDHRNNFIPADQVGFMYGYNRLIPPSGTDQPIDTPFPRTYLTTRSAANLWRVPLPGEAGGGSLTSSGVRERIRLNQDTYRPAATRDSGQPDNDFSYLTPAENDTLVDALLGTERRADSLFNDVVESTVAPAIPVPPASQPAVPNGFTISQLTGNPVAPEERPLLPRSAAAGTSAPAQPEFNEDNVDRFATQFLTNLQDYRDHDNRLTVLPLPKVAAGVVPGAGERVYGMEALPAITEVYAHRRYEAESGTPSGSGSGFDVVWSQIGTTGFAIEIGNPFDRPIPLHNVHLYITDEGGGGDRYVGPLHSLITDRALVLDGPSPGALDPIKDLRETNTDPATLVTDDGATVWNEEDMLQPGQSVILWREGQLDAGNPFTAPTEATVEELIGRDETGTVASLPPGDVAASEVAFRTDPPEDPTASDQDASDQDWPDDADNQKPKAIRLELRAESASVLNPANPLGHGNILPFAYQSVPLVTMPDRWTEEEVPVNYADPGPDPANPQDSTGFLQASLRSTDEGLNMLLVPAADFSFPTDPQADSDVLRSPRPGTTTTAAGTGFYTGIDSLGRDKAAPAGYTELPIDENQWVMLDDPDSELSSPAELATLLIIGPQESAGVGGHATVAEIFAASPDQELRNFRLSIDSDVAAAQASATTVVSGQRQLNNRRLIDPRVRTRVQDEIVAAPAPAADRTDPAADLVPVNPSWHIPHFLHLISSFTTEDRFYSSDKGLPTLAGPLNLNTVPLSLLADTFPSADEDFRKYIAATVGAARQEYAVTVNDGRTEPFGGRAAPAPGVSTVWELANPTYAAETGIDFLTKLSPYVSNDDFNAPSTPSFRIDYLPPEKGGVYGGADGVEDDVEEAILPVQMLDSLATTRSDVFVAYILLHGYERDKFDEGPKKVLRAITLFDRSQMETVQDDVRVEVLKRFAESPAR